MSLDNEMKVNWLCHLKSMFIHACALTIIVWLVLYLFTIVDTDSTTVVQSNESWNISGLIQTAVQKLQVIMGPSKTQRIRKLVLLWTHFYALTDCWLPPAKDLGCRVSECDITSNRSLLTNSSAVIIHWRNVDAEDLPECKPSENNQCPLWVLFNKEAPPHTDKDLLFLIKNKVHLTATYKKDSDIYAPYGKLLKRESNNTAATMPAFNPDRQLVCWLVSHCKTPNKREIYVKELEKYLDVHIYGKCGSAQCPHKLARDCYDWLSERCTFYLSFENSNCKDYVTEKLYYAMDSGMIPVVMGNFENYAHLPAQSYVHVNNFSSPKELSEYLVTVGKDEHLYGSYHKWRRNYVVEDFAFRWLCDLCEMLHSDGLPRPRSYKNLVSWWYDQSGCYS